VDLDQNDRRLDVLIELADKWGWRLLHHGEMTHFLDLGFEYSGAITTQLPDSNWVKTLRKRGIPTVRIGRFRHPLDNILPAVLPDLKSQGRVAAEHFAERHFVDVAFIDPMTFMDGFMNGPLLEAFTGRARKLGMRTSAYGLISSDDQKLSGNERYRLRLAKFRDWLHALPKPVGVFASSDGIAQTVAYECMAEKTRVPEELAILACGDSQLCNLVPVPLSAVQTGMLRQVQESIQLLKRLMAGNSAARQPVIIPSDGVVERASTDVLAASHPLAASAVQYIWQHIRSDPTVGEVADAMGVGRRTLERIFSETIGVGVKEEIRRRRMTLLCRELQSSDKPITDLAAELGYRSLVTMHRQFQEEMGTTPNNYRKKYRSPKR
jgi:AraC-like DNA-binding protein